MWLKSRGIARDAFARKVGCNQKAVDFWCDGKCLPSLLYAFAIEKATEGGVSAEAWLGTEIGKLQWKRLQDRVRA